MRSKVLDAHGNLEERETSFVLLAKDMQPIS